jgi:midasin (ATPase involved in ribosome maturation)
MFNTVIISLVLDVLTNDQSIINTVPNVPIQSVTIIHVQTVTNVPVNNVQSVINAVPNLLVNIVHYMSNFKSFSNAVPNIPTF